MLGNWVGQDYFSIQSMGFLVVTLLLFLLSKNFGNNTTTRQWFVLFIFLFAYLLTSHLLSSLVIASVCLVLLLFKQTYRKPLFLLIIFAVAGWTVLAAKSYLANNLAKILSQVLDVGTIIQGNLSNRLTTGSFSHMLAADIRVTYSLVIILFATMGVFVLWRKNLMDPFGKRMLFVLLGFGLLAFAFAYGGELYMRLYMFSLVPLSYFAAKILFKYKRLFLMSVVFFSVLAPSLFMISHYGNEGAYYVPSSEIVGVNFLYSSTDSGQIYGGTSFQNGEFRDALYHPNYTYYSYRDFYAYNTSSYIWTEPRDSYLNRYVCFSFATYSNFAFFYDDVRFIENIDSNVTQTVSYNKLYDNPSFELYNSPPLSNATIT
jgi:hypothetical protein